MCTFLLLGITVLLELETQAFQCTCDNICKSVSAINKLSFGFDFEQTAHTHAYTHTTLVQHNFSDRRERCEEVLRRQIQTNKHAHCLENWQWEISLLLVGLTELANFFRLGSIFLNFRLTDVPKVNCLLLRPWSQDLYIIGTIGKKTLKFVEMLK